MADIADVSGPVRESASAGLAAPVFFMHIAKTAGSYFNDILLEKLGPMRVRTHIELSIGGSAELRAALDEGVEVFSGHVMNGLWKGISGPVGRPFRKITIVREPIAHLASHLQWLDHYNRPDKKRDYLALDEAHRRVVDRVGAIDLGSPAHLDRFLTEMSPTEVRLFDNCQARYFLASGRRDLDSHRPLSLDDARALGREVAGFDAIARQDRLDMDIPRLGRAMGLRLTYVDRRVNTAGSERRVDTANPLVRQVLGKRTLLDQWLWRLLDREAREDA